MVDAPPRPAADRRPRRRRRWARRAGFTLLGLGLLAALTLGLLTRPFVLTPFFEARLAGALRAEVTLVRASLSPAGLLRLEGLAVRLPDDAEGVDGGTDRATADFRRLLDVDTLTLRVGKRDLAQGRIDLRRVEVDGPTLHAVIDGRRGRSNLAVWVDRFGGGEEPEGPPGPVTLPPAIAVRDASLEIIELREDASGAVVEATRRVLPFDGTVVPSGEGEAKKLAFALTGGVPEGAERRGSNVAGHWSPASHELVVGVERVDLGSPLGLLMPPAVRRFWRDLDPAGDLPAMEVVTRLDQTGSDRIQRASLEVEGLSFRLPLASLGLLPEGERDEDAPRMSGVSGTVEVAGGRLRTGGLTGEIEGIRVRIRGEAALTGGGPVALVAETDPFEVPAAPPLLFRLPGLISQVYGEYQPSGRFAAEVRIDRDAGAEVDVNGRLRILDARTVFHAFAYPVERLEGDLLFERDRLELRGLAGEGPGGGRVVLDGVITRPGPEAGIDLNIRVSEVPVDEALLAALDPPLRSIIGDFFSAETAERLAAEAPIGGEGFTPGGLLNGDVRVLRDTAIRPKSWIELDLDPEGLRVMMPAFAYPLTVRSGRLTAGPDEVRIEDLVATGPSGGAGVVRGRVGLGDPGAPPDIDFTISEAALPVDRHLLAAIAPEGAAWLRRLGVAGRVVGGGRVGSGAKPPEAAADGQLGLALDLRLVDGAMSLWGGELPIRPVAAGVRIDRESVRIDSLLANWPAGGTVEAEGRIGLTDGRLRLGFEGRGLGLDARTPLVIPPELPVRAAAAGLMDFYALEGRGDASVSIATPPTPGADDAGKLQLGVEVRPSELRGRYDGRPVALKGVEGAVVFGDDAAELRGLRGRHEAARLGVSGRIPYATDAEAAELEIEAEGPLGDAVLQAFAPTAVRDAVAAVGLDGSVRIADATLRLGPGGDSEATGGEATTPFAFDGSVRIREASASLGLPVEEAEVEALVSASGGGDRLWPVVQLEASAPSLRYGDRLARDLRLRGDNLRRPTVLDLSRIAAGVYGGRLSGDAKVRLGDDDAPDGPPVGVGSYAVSLALDGAAAEPVLFGEEAAMGFDPDALTQAAAAVSPAGTAPPERRSDSEGGRLWASISAAGQAGVPETLTGGGSVRVRGGDLLRGQWGIGLLRAINLGLPTGAPLGDADATFTLVDAQARLDRVRVSGEGLQIDGSGSVGFPGGDLFLTFFTSRETSAWLRGFQRVFDTIKDEFIGIEVTGTLWEPEARVSGLAALRGAVGERIGETAEPLILPAAPADATPAVTSPPSR